MNRRVIGDLVGGYISARNLRRALNAKEAAGFLITQFGVIESINTINSIDDSRSPGFLQDVLNHLLEASR